MKTEREQIIIQSIIKHLYIHELEVKDLLKENNICYMAINDRNHKKLKDKEIVVCIEIKDFDIKKLE
jgi:hypothetical protein